MRDCIGGSVNDSLEILLADLWSAGGDEERIAGNVSCDRPA